MCENGGFPRWKEPGTLSDCLNMNHTPTQPARVYYARIIGNSRITLSRSAVMYFEYCSFLQQWLGLCWRRHQAKQRQALGICDFSSSLAQTWIWKSSPHPPPYLKMEKKKKSQLIVLLGSQCVIFIGSGLCCFLQQDFIFERLFGSSQ